MTHVNVRTERGEVVKRDICERHVSDYLDSATPVVSSRTTIQDALRLVRGHGFPALPVCEGGRFLGLVREKDLLKMTPSQATLLSRHEIPALLDGMTVGTVMRFPPATVAHDLSLREAAEIMVKNSSEILPVLENGRYAGLISWVELMEAAIGTGGGST